MATRVDAACPFFSERLRPAVLNVPPVNMIFVKKDIVQLPLSPQRLHL
jgi:hypothetical protein